jgi:hypothetical protein
MTKSILLFEIPVYRCATKRNLRVGGEHNSQKIASFSIGNKNFL